jgi:hypothetical protein
MKACFHWVFWVLTLLNLIAFFVDLAIGITVYARDYPSVPILWVVSAGEGLVAAILFGLLALALRPRAQNQ